MGDLTALDVSELITRFGVWFAVVGGLLIMAALTAYQFRGSKMRRRQLAGRLALSEAEWFQTQFPADANHREVVRSVLKCLADDIGVKWTQLRSADSFEAELSIPRRYGAWDDLDEASTRMEMLAEEPHTKPKTVPPLSGSLADFLQAWVVIHEQRSHKGG